MDNKPTTTELIILISGVVVLVGSILDFQAEANAWSSFVYLLVAVFAIVMALQVAARVFARANVGDGIGTFSWATIHLLLAFYCAVLMIATLIEGDQGFDFEIGFWLMLIGSIGLLVGAVMLNQGRTAGTARPGRTV